MLDQEKVDMLVNDIQFELDLPDEDVINTDKRYSADDLKEWCDSTYNTHNLEVATNNDLLDAMSALGALIAAHHAKPIPDLSKDDIKTVYFKLKADVLRPKTKKATKGAHGLVDTEFTKLIEPPVGKNVSVSWIEIFNAGRNRKFINGVIAKYKPDNLEELESLFDTTKE